MQGQGITRLIALPRPRSKGTYPNRIAGSCRVRANVHGLMQGALRIDDQANARSIVVEADAKHAFVFAGAAFAERLDLALIHQAPERG